MDIKQINMFLYYNTDASRNVILSDLAELDLQGTPLTAELQSSAASVLLRNSVIRKADVSYETMSDDNLFSCILGTDLDTVHVGIYTLVSLVLMESYTIEYIVGKDSSYLKYLEISDITRERNNIDFLCYWFGQYRHYRFLVPLFRELGLAVAYAQGQIKLIKTSSDIATSTQDLSNAE